MSPSAPPVGDPAPADGALPAQALGSAALANLSAYVHVPFCASRCGYCDFNTYTSAELGSAPGASRDAYLAAVEAEIDLAVRVLQAGGSSPGPLETVYFGGGTPTLLPAADLTRILRRLKDSFGFAHNAEISTEANPDSVTPESLKSLVEGGFTRISFGMQSSVPHVLARLERTHTPGRAAASVGWAREAGFESVSVDLIYGTPGESSDEWRESVLAALACGPDHVSAYSLIVEDGTRLAARVRRGEVSPPDSDELADKYIAADELLAAAGLRWYEVSNWARPGHACRHNLAYWKGQGWWGFGPGAHSHVGGIRWWNHSHPRAYSDRILSRGESPALGREELTATERRMEQVMLELRLSDGLELSALPGTADAQVTRVIQEGLAVRVRDRIVLTDRGRLLADAVVRTLLE